MRYLSVIAVTLNRIMTLVHATPRQDSFQDPPLDSRPLFRYWMPDAGVDRAAVAADVNNAASVGASGLEFVAFFNYGGEMGAYPADADWGRNGFGTKPFQQLLRHSLLEHKKRGMRMDFAIGPNQGQGVPAYAGDEGLQWDLVPAMLNLGRNNPVFNGTLPGWGTGKLVAVVSGLVSSQTNISVTAGPFQSSPYSSYKLIKVDDRSLREHSTGQLPNLGHVSLSFNATSSQAERWLFAFYEKQTGNKNLVFESRSMRNIFDNGSFVVDHFSAKGAETVVRFWQDHIITDDILHLLREVGGKAWEDSIEVQSNMSWTPALPAMFEAQHGYRIHQYLPLLMWGNNNINLQQGTPGRIRAILDRPDAGQAFINDYRATLALGYAKYLEKLSHWAHQLGVDFSTQMSYNLPLNIAASIPLVDVPETESLQFADNVDGYRQVTGIAALAGKNIVSNEMGAKFLKSYRYTFQELLHSIHRALAGGVNRFVLHGMPYGGSYYNTTWPGYTAFQFFFSEMYTPRQPSWNSGFADVMKYVSRTVAIQQKGVRRIDVAVYHKASASDPNFRRIYSWDDLVEAGYDYGYVSSETFELPQAKVEGGVFGPNGPRFQALVLTSQSNLTVDCIERITAYAEGGLCIVISGTPGYHATASIGAQDRVNIGLSKLVKTKNVYICEDGKVGSVLRSLGIRPRAGYSANVTWYTTWREDQKEGIDYLFALGDSRQASGQLQVATTKIPYLFDAWTGQRQAILEYATDEKIGTTTIPITLAANQAILIGFSDNPFKGIPTPKTYISKLPASASEARYKSNGELALMILPATGSKPRDQTLSLSDGTSRKVNVPSSSQCSGFELREWTVIVEHWESPRDIFDVSVIASKRNTTHQLTSPLPSWPTLKDTELANSSGIGYYSTSFNWPLSTCPTTNSLSSSGAIITFPPVLHGLRVSINGKTLPTLDHAAPKADITPYLKTGNNKIVAMVPTVMWNYLRTIAPQLRSAADVPLHLHQEGGSEFFLPLPDPVDAGLIGRVTLTPYIEYQVQT